MCAPGNLDTEPGAGYSLNNVKEVLTDLGIKEGPLGVTEDNLPAAIYKKIVTSMAPLQPVDLSPVILEQRMVKEPGQIIASVKAGPA